jgi:ACT domain-containing protein
MRGIVSVLGKDRPGIIAKVSAALYECNVNILDIDQTVLRGELFAMTMLTDLERMNTSFGALKERLESVSAELGMQIRLQREEIFNSMHRV